MKLVPKVLLLMALVGALPLTLALAQLVPKALHDARESEKRNGVLAAREVGQLVTKPLDDARQQADAVGAIFRRAALSEITEGQAIEAVRALLSASGRTSVRFEVPSADVSALLRVPSTTFEVPRSTPDLQRTADDLGFVFRMIDAERGIVVVPIRGTPKPGYVTATFELGDLPTAVDTAVAASFPGEQTKENTGILVVDSQRRVILSYGLSEAKTGSDATAHPVFAFLEGDPRGDMSLGTTFTARGETMSARVMIFPEGMMTAVWRPESAAFAGVNDVRRAAWVSAIAAALLAVALGAFAARALTLPILALAKQAKILGQRRWRDLSLRSDRKDEIGDLYRSFDATAKTLEADEKEIVRQTELRADLGRFLSSALVDAIVKGEHELSLGGRRATISVMFADVVAFTPLAESRPAEQVVALLNELFSLMTEVVFRHGGTVDKFVGDCLMAVWGAPIADPGHAKRALAAAEDMMRLLETANETWREKYETEIRLGIGVNSGEAIVGNLGSDKRMEYTVIGDVVNVAARLEAIARPDEVLVAAATRELAGDAFQLTLLGERKLTGRTQSTKVYSLDLD